MLLLPSNISRAIFLDVDSFAVEEFTNGATIQYREIFQRLRHKGVECAVATFTQSSDSLAVSRPDDRIGRAFHCIANIPVIEYLLPASPEQEPELYAFCIEQAIREIAPDLIIINTPPNRLYEVEVMMFEIIAQSKISTICFVPDDHFPCPEVCDPHLFQRFYNSIESFNICAPSRFIAERVKTVFGAKVEIFPNLFTLKNIECGEIGEVCERRYITLINPHPLKGIEIFEAIAKRNPNLDFMVVRGWPYPPVYRNSVSNIKVMPFMRSLKPVWQETGLLLVPSLCNEGFGRVVIEAMLNGIPVIGHDIGGLPEAIDGAGILIEPPPIVGTAEHPHLEKDDLEKAAKIFTEKINSLLDTKPNYCELSRKAKASAMNTIASAEEKFDSVFNKCRLPSPVSKTEQKILILSPHSDDVAFSFGGTLLALGLEKKALLVTVFGRSNYLLESEFNDDWVSVTNVRRAEDEAFASKMKIDLIYCDLPEAALRFGSSYEDVFAEKAFDEVPLSENITDKLMEIASSFEPSHIVAPLGIGNHKDHIAVRNQALNLAKEFNAKILFYEDLPYAAELTFAEIKRHVCSISPTYYPLKIFLDGQLGKKMELIDSYASQLSDENKESIYKYALALQSSEGAERLWVSDSVLELFDNI